MASTLESAVEILKEKGIENFSVEYTFHLCYPLPSIAKISAKSLEENYLDLFVHDDYGTTYTTVEQGDLSKLITDLVENYACTIDMRLKS